MAGRERIPVEANDTLERVLDRLRSSQAEEIVLDVDGRSPLLSVPNLDMLEETAKHQGVRITIASTSSKVLSAARVFGLPVIDTTAIPAPTRTRPDPHARLLAGEPLGDADAPVVGGVAVADAAPDEAAQPARPAPVIAFQTVTVGEETGAETEEAEEGWAGPVRTPRPSRARARRAPVAPSDEAAQPRLDPYGQPYTDEPEEADDDLPPRRNRRRAAAPPPPAADKRAEEGWDDALVVDDEPFEEYRDEQRSGLFGGLRAFWADVRERVAARRRPDLADEESYDEDEVEEPGTEKDDEGWDEPPYRARLARSAPAGAAAPVPPVEDEALADDTGELPEPIPARPARTIRSLDDDRIDTARQPTARLRPVPSAYDETDAEEIEEEDDEYEEDAGRRRIPAGLLVWALIALLALGLVGVVVAYVLVPRATVTLVARTGTPEIGFNVVVGEIDPNSPQGQANDERIVVPAKRIIVPVNASANKTATGSRAEPDKFAGGPVTLGNPSGQAVAVPKGTVLTTSNNSSYVTQEDVSVPPGDPTTFEYGRTAVKVAAQTRGSDGNAAIGAVRGTLPNGISFNNLNAPIAGGSDILIPRITKDDLAAAQAAAEAAARGKWPAELNGAVPAGSQAMRDTAGLGAFRVEFNAKEGADGNSVTATVVADATVLVYSMAEVEASARAEAEDRIASAAPPGETIIPGSVQPGTPHLASEVPGTMTFRMTATARTRAVIGSEAERAQLASDLAHLSDDEAHKVLARLPSVSSATIEYDTGPFPQRMPWRARQIEVVVAER